MNDSDGHQAITSTNRGGSITITAAMLMVFMVLFYIIRILVRIGFKSSVGFDDIVITIGSVFGIVQSILVMLAVKAGLGKKLHLLSPRQIEKVYMFSYACDLIFIVTIALAKISAAGLIVRLSRQNLHLNSCRVVAALAAIWGASSVLVIGIGCNPRAPKNLENRCPSLLLSWTTIAAIGLSLELILLCLPVWLVWPLQMPRSKKFVVTIAFSLRLVIVPLVLGRIIELNRSSHSRDWTFDAVRVIIFTQLEMHLSLISATLPCTRPFLNAASSGMWADNQGIGRSTRGTPVSSYAMNSNISKPSRHSWKKISVPISYPSVSFTGRRKGPSSHDEVSDTLPAHLEATEEHPILNPFSQPTLTTIEHPMHPSLNPSSEMTLATSQFRDQESVNSFESDHNFIKKTMEYDIHFTRSTRKG
ncbi:hypothetical protein EG328_003835 [Venturia inaequalis]|uniref:Rhodopsin domain-containing protein n=1 Tax=Venturia inaequalis TaxID=5025 RepID=A0A8H3Z8H5_VENIN|nr:hypothetical protein EG328_003835 [Venturia inaequalis]